ncbi:MAG TPA: hypothetical protein VKT80_03565, partial [Chloroflexota bacterium]|nr:hypothetical protein [Chloroflexota bacterium]
MRKTSLRVLLMVGVSVLASCVGDDSGSLDGGAPPDGGSSSDVGPERVGDASLDGTYDARWSDAADVSQDTPTDDVTSDSTLWDASLSDRANADGTMVTDARTDAGATDADSGAADAESGPNDADGATEGGATSGSVACGRCPPGFRYRRFDTTLEYFEGYACVPEDNPAFGCADPAR